MSARHGWALVSLFGAVIGIAACSETPTSPQAPVGRGSYAPLQVQCTMEAELLCSVFRFGEGDLTAGAEWYATGLPWGTVPEPGVSFPRPGVPVASRPVKLYIAARVGTETDASSFAYEMAPGARPVLLAMLTGLVYEGDVGFTGLEGVDVQILDGEGMAGSSTTTNVSGFYAMSYVRVGVPFTIRATKNGYEPSLARHDGIKALPEGLPDFFTTSQHFRLKRRP